MKKIILIFACIGMTCIAMLAQNNHTKITVNDPKAVLADKLNTEAMDAFNMGEYDDAIKLGIKAVAAS